MLKKIEFKSIKINNLLILFLTFFLLNLVFYFFSQKHFSENGVYYKYFQSMIQDKDFNIFNQFSNPFDLWSATVKHNHIDYHSPFFSALTLVPYGFFKLILNHISIDNEILGLQLFFTLSLTVLVVLKNYVFDDKKNYNFFFIAILVSNAALYELFINPCDLSLICLSFSLIIFLELHRILRNPKRSVVTLGLTLGLFSILKNEGIIYPLVILPFLFNKIEINKFLKILGIVFFCLAQILIVNYNRYGVIYISNPVLTFNHYYVFSYLFGPNGLLIKNPTSAFSLISMIYFMLFSTVKN